MPSKPTRLNAQTVTRICKAVETGMFIAAAARMEGISESTWYEWRCKAKQGLAPYTAFLHQIETAELRAQHYYVSRLHESAKKDWRCAMTVLERRFRAQWAQDAKPRKKSRPPTTAN